MTATPRMQQTSRPQKRADSPAPSRKDTVAESLRFTVRKHPENPGWKVPPGVVEHTYSEIVQCDANGVGHCQLETSVEHLRRLGYDLVYDRLGKLPLDAVPLAQGL